MRYDASRVKDLAENTSEQRKLAHWLLELDSKTASVLVDMYRSRPRTVEGAQTRLLGRRGPTGSILSGGDKFVRARFPRARLQRWARAFFAAHGAVDGAPEQNELDHVEEFIYKYGLPARYHTLLNEDV